MDTMYEYTNIGTDNDDFVETLRELLRQGWEAIWHDNEFEVLLRRPLEYHILEYTWGEPGYGVDYDEGWVLLGIFDDGDLEIFCRPLSK